MAKTKLGDGTFLMGGANIGDGDINLTGLNSGSVTVNPASLAAATRAGTAVTIQGVAVGDVVMMVPPAALEDDLLFVGARVTAADEVTVYLYNPTGAPIDGAALSWDYLHFALSS